MTKKCIYCGCKIFDECVMEVCDECGKQVWGEKMFRAIVHNMDNARDNGDLCHMNNPNEIIDKEKFR